MKNIFRLLTLVVAMACLAMTGCKKDNTYEKNYLELILGEWHLTNIQEGSLTRTPEELGMEVTTNYKENGTYHTHYQMEFYGDLLEQDEHGTYSLTDDGGLNLAWEEDGENMTAHHEIKQLDEETLVVAEHYMIGEASSVESIRTYKR